VLAGVAELMIAVATFAAVAPPSELAAQILVRVAVYTVAFVLIGLTWRGHRFARWAVLIMLGVLGTGSMLVPLIGELAAGAGLADALGAGTSPYFPLVRAAHLLLVITGSILLLTAGRQGRATTPRLRPAVSSQPQPR
jgi:hypothetical protein